MTNQLSDRIARARATVDQLHAPAPFVGIVLGSGLGGLAALVRRAATLPYREIPGFLQPTAPGHAGELVLGRLAGVPVAMLVGRSHLYEGLPAAEVAFPIRVLHALGARTLLATNASGGIAGDLRVGDVVVLRDHVNLPGLAGNNPLLGQGPEAGPRFVSLHDAYDPALQAVALEALQAAGVRARTGVYAMVAGPNYETPAEIRWLRLAGADVVGMSTVPEVLVARQLAMRVVALSLVTNSHATSSQVTPEDVVQAAAAAGERLANAAQQIVTAIGTGR